MLMIGEIRDEETAAIGIRAALTGVLVFSTIHASDAAGTVTTLFNYGIPGYTLSSALQGVVNQRLVRTICPTAGRPTGPTTRSFAILEPRPGRAPRPDALPRRRLQRPASRPATSAGPASSRSWTSPT